MSWTGVITDVGAEILAQWHAGGHTLTIDGATVGSGITPAVDMRNATDLVHEEDTAQVIQAEAVDGGTRFKVQVLAADTAYTAHEIGIWGHLDSGTSTLLALHVDPDTGVSVPDSATSPDFAFALFCIHAISNTEELEITVDTSVFATIATLNTAVADVIRYSSQSLTTEQKTQARTNIGAASTAYATTSSGGLMSPTDKGKVDNSASTNDLATVKKITSDEFSAALEYNKGDYCIYLNKLYRAKQSTGPGWNAFHWEQTTVADEIKNRSLLFQGVSVAAVTSGTLITKNDSRITAKHVVDWITFANQSAITSDLTCTPSAGKLTVTGTCTSSTTADIKLSLVD